MKSVVWNVFSIITVLVMSLMAWSAVIGVYASGFDAPSMFNNYSMFKENVWYTLESAYADRYAAYTERAGVDYYLRTDDSWDAVVGTGAVPGAVTVENGVVK